MRRIGLCGAASACVAATVFGADEGAEGRLPEKEGYVVAGTVAGEGGTPIHLELGREVAAPVVLHGLDWSWQTADVKPGGAFRFTGLPPGRYHLWTQGRRVQQIDVFGDVTGVEFRALTKRLGGRVRTGFPTKSKRMTIEFTPEDGTGETRFEVAPDAEFAMPPVSLGRHAVEIWWNQEDAGWWDDPHRWTWIDVTPETKRFDFDFAPACDVRLSVKSAGRAETFEGQVFDADLPRGAGFHFEAAAKDDANLGTRSWGQGVFGAGFGRPTATVPFLNVVRGTHRFRVEAQGFEPVEKTVEVGDGTTPFDVEMKPIPGSFVFAEGWGKIFEVFVRPAEGGGPWKSLLFGDNRSVPTDTDPMRPHELLAPGKWEFFATSGTLAPSRPQTIELGADHAEVKIDFPGVPGATLRATLRTPSGRPLVKTETCVFVKDGDEHWRRLRAKAPLIDEKGAFTIEGLAPGEYRLAFDENGRHVFGEFAVEGKDLRRDFVSKRDR